MIQQHTEDRGREVPMTGTTAPAPPHRRHRWERVALCIALLPPALFVLSTVPGVRPEHGYNLMLDGLLNNLAYGMAPVICLLRVRTMPGRRLGGYLLAAALAVYGSGNVYWTVVVRPLVEQPFPSGADALFLGFYPLAFAALTFFLRGRSEKLSASLWLDGLVGGLAVGAVTAAAVIGPIVSVDQTSFAAIATTTAYPLLDLVLLLVVAVTLSLYRWRPPVGLWFLTGGLVLFVLADVAYLFATARETYVSGGPTDGIWVLAVILMAVTPGWAAKATGPWLPTWALIAIPLVSTTTALGLLVADHSHRQHPAAFALAAATVVVALVRLVVTFREVASLAHSRELALTDELTGLANRRALYEDAPRRIGALDPGEGVALLLLDLDRFKEVNDSLGHQAGDLMLRDVGARLRPFAPHRADQVVRLGGDEFALLLTSADLDQARAVSQEVKEVLARPITVNGIAVHVGVSIGIATMPAATADLPSLLRQADVAMYQAKARRLGVFAYQPELDEFLLENRLETVELLRTAIADRSMVIHYQPKVETRGRQVRSVEALVRWQHPTRGLLLPGAFLPLVEDAGLMEDLTAAVLEQALDQAVVWHQRGCDLAVAVNLSASSLVDQALPARVAAMLQARALPARALELEITEDFLMADRMRAQLILAGLRDRGIRVAVDDYGTGYSSLAYLKELPVDDLKLDKSFLEGVTEDERAFAIVRSTIMLAHSLGLRLVAEGVEDAATSRKLAEAGCDVEQGWFYAKAMPAEELETWLELWLATAGETAPGVRSPVTA
jgi:diguanylate cyclase (GGDEF)-like protein